MCARCARKRSPFAGDDAQIRRRRLGKRISNLSLSLFAFLSLGALSLSREKLSRRFPLFAVISVSIASVRVITRGNKALLYVSLLYVVVVVVKKKRKISSERVRALEKNLPFSTPPSPPNHQERQNLKKKKLERDESFCVW